MTEKAVKLDVRLNIKVKHPYSAGVVVKIYQDNDLFNEDTKFKLQDLVAKFILDNLDILNMDNNSG